MGTARVEKRRKRVPLINAKRILTCIILLGCTAYKADAFLSGEWVLGAPTHGRIQLVRKSLVRVQGNIVFRKQLPMGREPNNMQISERYAEDNETKKHGPKWERIACAAFIGNMIKRKRTSKKQKHGPHAPWGEIRTGGGPTKHMAIKNQAMGQRKTDLQPVALSKWDDWYGANANDMQSHMTERLMGGMIDD